MRLVIFDFDGTLVDSESLIVGCMQTAFAARDLAPPTRQAVHAIIGLSLPIAMARLAPAVEPSALALLVAEYKAQFTRRRSEMGVACSPLFPGALAALDRLAGQGRLISIATGKARRGLDEVLDAQGLRDRFAFTQTADDAPSKPDPGMVLNTLAALGVAPDQAVMVGDTTFDIEMARAAGVPALGVSWGYHPVPALQAAGAAAILSDFDALDAALGALG